ncbi:MAG: citrate synthase [Fimbriimonadaceae bacterium]|nr:citrate synthase [Fimbriimonadaceae bacterium]
MSSATHPDYRPGLEGVIGGITKIAEINSASATLTYRGINVHELAEKSTYEETAYLLINGRLPTAHEFEHYKRTLAHERPIPESVSNILKLIPRNIHPMDALKVAYSALAAYDPDYAAAPTDHAANVRKAERIIAKAATIVAAHWRICEGKEPISPDPELDTAANFLYMLSGERADEETVKVMDASLILYAEHTFNASTFANRVTVATLSDLYSGIVTGIGTLKGPLHGGANEEAMRMLLEIGTPENAEPWLRSALAGKKKVMGFGHREYKNGDSRAAYLTKMAKKVAEKKGVPKWVEIGDIMTKIMVEEKNIHPNVDFPAAYAYYMLGIPIDLYTPIFVIARVAGWSAHAIEQLDNNRLIRPTCIYDGRSGVPYVPMADR